MTNTELTAERRHIFETRLAILEAGTFPTNEQHNIASAEADAHIEKLRDGQQQSQADMFNEIRRAIL